MKEIKKLIKDFKKEHKKVYNSDDGDYSVECSIVDNYTTRTAPRKEWLGDDESWKRAKEEEKEGDKSIRCPTCEFIKKIKELSK